MLVVVSWILYRRSSKPKLLKGKTGIHTLSHRNTLGGNNDIKKQPLMVLPFFSPSESKFSPAGESSCHKIPIKEIYSATNDLSHLNFIGQGMAGELFMDFMFCFVFFF